jgi:hypothetical protein
MTRKESHTVRPVDNGSQPRFAPLAIAAPRAGLHDDIDDALDGVVTTLDDLVRDLAAEPLEPQRLRYVAVPEQAPVAQGIVPVAQARVVKRSTLRTVALVAVVVLVALIVEYVLLESIISSP